MLRLMENTRVDKHSTAQALIAEFSARLVDLEAIGSHVAAAHLSAAIDALVQDFAAETDASGMD